VVAGAVLAASSLGPALSAPTAPSSLPGLKVEVLDLKRDGGGGVTLTFTITNDTDKAVSLSCQMRGDGNDQCAEATGVYLIDAVNKKRYLVMRDTQNKCICTDSVGNLPAKASISMWAKFAAPPATVMTVTAVVPLFLPLDGVAITGP
jgi:hypothetical protein